MCVSKLNEHQYVLSFPDYKICWCMFATMGGHVSAELIDILRLNWFLLLLLSPVSEPSSMHSSSLFSLTPKLPKSL